MTRSVRVPCHPWALPTSALCPIKGIVSIASKAELISVTAMFFPGSEKKPVTCLRGFHSGAVPRGIGN